MTATKTRRTQKVAPKVSTHVEMAEIIRTHHDGRFAVAVTGRDTESGQLVLMVQKWGSDDQMVTVLGREHLLRLLAISEGK